MIARSTVLWYAYTVAVACSGLIIHRVFSEQGTAVMLLTIAIISVFWLAYYRRIVLPRLEAHDRNT